MDDEGNCLSLSSTKSNKMENTPKPNNGSKVKLKIIKKKVHIRRPNGLNRSNTSFNTSLNASMRMKQTLTTNNRALAQALQLTKQDLALATDLISGLKRENKDLMMEKAETNHIMSQGIDGQVNEKIKPFLLVFKAKVHEVSNRLVDVASALKDLSSTLSSQLCSISNASSRVNSLENYQDLPTPESTEMPSTETVYSPNRRSSFCPPLPIQNSGQTFNDLSLIAESSFLNLDQVQNSMDVLDMVLENESEKYKMSDVKSVKVDKPPQRVPVEARRSRSRQESMSRRRSMDEIDFGSNVVQSRKSRRSSFMLSVTGLEKALPRSPGTALKNDETDSDYEGQDDDEDDKKVETEQLPSPTLLEDDAPTSRADPPVIKSTMEIDEVFSDMNQGLQPELPASRQSNSPVLFPESPVQQQQQDLAPVVADASLVTAKTVPCTQAEEIDRTILNEVDMEMTDVINASVHLNVEVSSLPDAQSTKKTEEPTSADTKGSSQNEDPTFVKPLRAPKKKTESKKDEKKQTKNTKEKMKEASSEAEGKAVVELRLPKPGKITFSTTRKNIAGVRPSPPKARSKKKLAEMKKNELTAEPKNLFDFHDKTPQMLVKKSESVATGIYDVSLNDSVYGTCQSLGEYRERVAMAKRISSVSTSDVPSSLTSSADAAQTEVCEGNGDTAVETVPDISTKSAEEKKKRARSKNAADGNDEKRKRCRSKKRAANSESDSESDGDRTYVKHYQKTVKSGSTDAPEREFTRRARSKVISYKEEESDFDVTLIEKKALVPLKNTEEKQKVKVTDFEDSSAGTKEEIPKRKSARNGQDLESKNAPKKEMEHKSLKGTDEKRTRSRKKSVAEVKNIDHSDCPLSEGAENSAPEKSDAVPKSTTQSELQNLISRMEKLKQKRSRSQHRSETKPEEETQNPTEAISKPKSTSRDISERYKQALTLSNDSDHKGELKKRESSKSRSRPARNESSDKTTDQNKCGRSRSLHVQKSSDSMDDKVKSTPERKRSRSVAKRVQKANEPSPPSSPLKKQEESPEAGKTSKTERGRSKSRARSNARSKCKVLGNRSTSAEKKPEEGTQNPTEAISKPKSTGRDIFERYKQALNLSNDPDHKGELKKRESSKSRSRPARNGSSDKTTAQIQSGMSHSLHVQKSSDSMDDKVKSTPEGKRSRSVAKRVQKANEPSSPSFPLKKQEESPETGKTSKTERGRSKSRARSNARSKCTVVRNRSTSAEKKPEESPDTLQRKIRKERGRSRSKVAVAKNDDLDVMDNKMLASDDTEVVKPVVDSDRRKTVRSRSIAGRELLLKLKSSNANKENKATTDANVQDANMDATRKSESSLPESSLKEPKCSLGHSNQASDTLKTLSTKNVQVKIPTVSPKRSLEKNYGKRSSEYNTNENQDLKRPRRVTKLTSYKEPSIQTKLRQGDKLFGEVPVKRISSGHGHLPPKTLDGELRKRSILENVTNLNC